MKTISIKAERDYEVLIGGSYLSEVYKIIEGRNRVAIIFSENMKSLIPQEIQADASIHYFPIPDAEAGKSSSTLLRMWDWLGAAGFTRSDLIIAIGGGAVTDLAGYAAASWLRGIDWVAIPTTLAGMVDASVGGKTGINSDYGKNLIGAFHSPIQVVIDLQWLETLSDRDFSAGLAEVIKCGFIADDEILSVLEEHSVSSIRADAKLCSHLIERSVAVKARVVSHDFKESGAREALNYGHTFGHAVEKDSGYSIRHGESVAIGLHFVAELSFALGVIEEKVRDRHIQLLSQYQLPVSYKGKDWNSLLSHMKVDKKARGNRIRFVALDGIGKTQVLEDVTDELLHQAYEKINA